MNTVQNDNLVIEYAENQSVAFDESTLESDATNASQIDIIQDYLNDKFEFRYNFVTNRVLFRSLNSESSNLVDMRDFDFNTILKDIKRAHIKCAKDTLRMILESNFVNGFEPYISFVDSLSEWDGTDYILQLAQSVETTDNEYWNFCLKKWIVAMLGGWYDDKIVNHTVIVFSGEQGVGKTRWFRSIIPESLLEYFSSGYIQPKDREVNVKISECCLILMDELENMSAANIADIKALITQETTFMRRAYTTRSQAYKHRASFAGTVNDKQFLHDTTGNRRFLCFEAMSINEAHGIPLDQLYAQAKNLLNSGFQFWFDKVEIAELNLKNNEYRFVTSEEDMLSIHFEKCTELNATDFLSTTEIVQYIRERVPGESLTILKMGKVLAAKKFLRLKKRGRYVYALKQK